MPDFDVDFCTDRRGEVIEYAKRRYGFDHVSNIATYGNMQAKNAIRDVSRVLRYPLSETDKITKEIPLKPVKKPPVLKYYFGTTGKEEDKQYIIPELRRLYEEDEMVKKIVDMAIKLEGVPRNISMHAAGVLIAPDPVYDHVPMAKSGNDVITQFDMLELEHLGLLKMDFLGLITLTDIHKALKYIKENHGVEIDFAKMDYNDPKVFELISSGNTDSVFQLDGSGMKKFMKDLQPSCLEDVIAGISLYRPGPMDFIPRFIEGKRNPEKIVYDDPCLEPVLKTTYGCIVYQEQVMKIFQVMAGYSLGGADNVRRIMGKKQVEKIQFEKEKFLNGYVDPTGQKPPIPGALALGHDKDVSIKIFDQMAKFAGYAFNKSHAAAYAYVAYQTAYLKTYYEVEFLTAVLNNRIASADNVKKFTNYARKEGFEILPPDINKSNTLFKTENGNIRFGLGALKNVGTAVTDYIMQEREKNGEFKSFEDFISRCACAESGINKRTLEALILSGAFSSFGKYRSQLMDVYPLIMERTIADKKKKATGQFSIFDTFEEESAVVNSVEYPKIKEYNKETLLKNEKAYAGIYLSGHPLDDYIEKYDSFTFTSDMFDNLSQEGEENFEQEDFGEELNSFDSEDSLKDGQQVVCGGQIVEVSKKLTKSGNMCFLQIEDIYGTFEVIVFAKAYNKYKDLLVEDGLVTIRGKVSLRPGSNPVILAESVSSWQKKEEENNISEKKLYLRFDTKDPDVYGKVKTIVSSYPGESQIVVKCNSSGSAFAFSSKVDINNYLINELIGLLGEANVVLK